MIVSDYTLGIPNMLELFIDTASNAKRDGLKTIAPDGKVKEYDSVDSYLGVDESTDKPWGKILYGTAWTNKDEAEAKKDGRSFKDGFIIVINNIKFIRYNKKTGTMTIKMKDGRLWIFSSSKAHRLSYNTWI